MTDYLIAQINKLLMMIVVFLSGETGLLLSKICSQSPFFGYAGSKQLTEKKILRDVFVKGDAYFNTGDLMAEDEENFISFKDRVGDTYRYKLVYRSKLYNHHVMLNSGHFYYF